MNGQDNIFEQAEQLRQQSSGSPHKTPSRGTSSDTRSQHLQVVETSDTEGSPEHIRGRGIMQNVYIDVPVDEALAEITKTVMKGTRNSTPSRSLAAYYLIKLGLAEWERQGRPPVPKDMRRTKSR